MTVRQLIIALKKLDQNRIVILQEDAEGNGYSPLVGVEQCVYRPRNTWSGETYNPEREDEDYHKEKGDRLAVVLWPVN